MKEIIKTDKAPAAIGPYSQGVKSGSLLFVSGQIPLDPASGEMVPGGAAEQTRQDLENLKAVLEAGGSSLDRVLKCTVFLADMSLFGEMNGVYQEYFPAAPPARAAFSVKELPKGALVEIEAVAECG